MFNKLKNVFVLATLISLISTSVFGQFSREDAIDLVLNTILTDDIGKVNVYASNISFTTDITSFNNNIISNPYADSWVFFVDDNPFASLQHDCRYIFIDIIEGDQSIIVQMTPPLNLESDFQKVSSFPLPPLVDLPVGAQEITEDESEHLYAVLIDPFGGTISFNSMSLLYNSLLELGYKKENIFIHYYAGWNEDFDNDQINDVDYPASKEAIAETFANLSGINTIEEIPELQHGDQLFIAGSSGFSGMNDFYVIEDPDYYTFFIPIHAYEFAGYVENIKTSQMVFLLNFGYAESFADNLMNINTAECKNRSLHTSTSVDDEYYHFEVYISNYKYYEYIYYWAAAIRGFYPVTDEPWNPSEYNTGEFPFSSITGLEDHPADYDPDTDGDGYIQMEEAFAYADDQNTWSYSGYHNPYDPEESETPTQNIDITFSESLLTMRGLAGEVKYDQTIPGNFCIGGDLNINSNAELNMANESELYFQDGNSRIYIDGELHIGDNSLIVGQDESFAGLIRTNTNSLLTIGSGTEFNNIRLELTGYPLMDYLLMNDLTFNNFDINGQVISLDVTNSNFNNGWMQISHCDNFNMSHSKLNYSHLLLSGNSFTPELSVAHISDCEFKQNNVASDAVWISNVPEYFVENSIFHGYATGLNIFYSGQEVKGTVSNNEFYDNSVEAIGLYHSDCTVRGNHIHDNSGRGVSFSNNSNIALYGNKLAQNEEQTQRIKDNGSYEVYADATSFPHHFMWNAIIDDDNNSSGDELVYYDAGIFANPKDVRNNHWGQNFNPLNDLYPYNGFIWDPVWNFWNEDPGNTSAGLLYESATENAENGNVVVAKEEYKQIVDQYPESKFASASLKELYGIEALADDNYLELKQYLESNETINNNVILAKLGDFLANRCDVKLENYEEAIAWYENVIANPPSYPEYIYAMIDLGFTYLLMEDGGDNKSSAYVGSMPEFKPKSDIVHRENTVFYLSLLPKKDDSYLQNELINMKVGELLQNVPNPFTTQTDIYYKLETEAKVKVKVFNTMGQQVAVFNEGHKNKGTHQLQFTVNNLNSGLYLYTLEINGKVSDTKKMTIR